MGDTRESILELIDGEEPDYVAAAAAIGLEGLPVLATMVVDPDPTVAARAASIVATMADDASLVVATVPLLAAAAVHADSGVRAAAAVGASRAGSVAVQVVKICLGDIDPGVRYLAFRGLSPPLDPSIAAIVDNMAAGDGDPAVQDKAVALAARNPDPSIANELLAEALEYAHARLTEFRAAALGGVASFAAAAGVPGFVDAGGAVANLLLAARNALDAFVARLSARDHAGAAAQIGLALGGISNAATAVGGASFLSLLLGRIAWANARPAGLAQQLGLPVSLPALTTDGNALVYRIGVPGRKLIPAPLTFGFDSAQLSARVRMGVGEPALAVSLAFTGIEVGVGGGPVASLLGGAGGSAHADVELGVDTSQGLTVGGGAGTRVVLPARPKMGPLDLREIVLELPPHPAGTIDVSSAITVTIAGAITAVVDGAGLHVRIDSARAAQGNNPLGVAIKPPDGIGLTLDTGLLRGGGFLESRGGGYGGALELRLGPVDVRAVGLLTLEPRFALVVVMSIEFMPPIDLTFGFTLNAVGGVVGIEHRLDIDALRATLPTGSLDHIMFPADPVAAAPVILTTLEGVFPVDAGSIVIGPMIEIGWGRPVSFLTAQLGVLLSLPDPAIVIIGRVRIALPAPELPIVDLRATVYGEITPDHLLILVTLNGSRIATFAVFGDMGLLVRWGGSPEVAVSAGGFHPRYAPPRELTGMQRLGMDLSPPAILTLRSESYFAVTTNSVQLGAHVEMGGDIGVADISGYFGFDALVVSSPHFAFLLDVGAGLTVHVMGATVAGVQLQLHLEGPAPWHAQGTAEVEVLLSSVPIDVGPFTWGDADNPPPLPVDPRQLAHDALHNNPGAWQALTPADSDRVVRLKPAPPSDVEVTVHPMGLFDVRQHAIPLETVITRVGAHPVPEGQRRVHLGVPLVNEAPAGALSEVTDLFSAGVFLDLEDDQKLSRPAFEPMPAGARIRPPGEVLDFNAARETDLRYETFVCDDEAMRGRHSVATKDLLIASAAAFALAAGSAGRSALRARSRYASEPDPLVLADAGEVQVRSKADLSLVAGAATVIYTHAAEAPLAADAELTRLGVA
jgi:hypothetical protein